MPTAASPEKPDGVGTQYGVSPWVLCHAPWVAGMLSMAPVTPSPCDQMLQHPLASPVAP